MVVRVRECACVRACACARACGGGSIPHNSCTTSTQTHYASELLRIEVPIAVHVRIAEPPTQFGDKSLTGGTHSVQEPLGQRFFDHPPVSAVAVTPILPVAVTVSTAVFFLAPPSALRSAAAVVMTPTPAAGGTTRKAAFVT